MYQNNESSDGSRLNNPTGNWIATTPTYGIIDTETGGITKVGGEQKQFKYYREAQANEWLGEQKNEPLTDAVDKIQSLRTAIADADGDTDAAAKKFQFENPYTGEPLEEGQTVTIREGDGMIDLLGDKRNVQEVGQVDDFEAYVDNNPDVLADYNRRVSQGYDGSKADFGKGHYDAFGKREGRELTQKTDLVDTGRQVASMLMETS